MTLVCTATPVSARKPRPDDTLKFVPVSLSASRPPTGSVTSTLKTMMIGNLRLPYSANRMRRIRTSVSGMMTFICSRAAR